VTKQRHFAFTMRRLEALPVPEAGRVYHYDIEVPRLAVCVTATGSRTFYVVKKVGGRSGACARVSLGKFPAMTVDAARKAARVVVTDYDNGKDPLAERQARRHEQTVGGLWAFWLEHAKSRKRTWGEDSRLYEKFCKSWANRKLSTIRKADIAALHAKVGKESGPYQANRVLALVRAMFNRGGDIGYGGANPAVGVKRFREEQRDRFLQAEELPRFFEALNAEPNENYRDALTIAILTGARRGNVLGMRWDDLDLDRGLWRIPAAVAKAGVSLVIPLVPAAVTLLQNRRLAANSCPWVFPSRGKTGHLVETKSVWKRILARAGLSNIRFHDLRRTLGSWQALGGSSLQVISKSLGHQQIATTMIYSRLTVDPVRESMQKATDAIYDYDAVSKPVNEQAGDDTDLPNPETPIVAGE
jgi:integrase